MYTIRRSSCLLAAAALLTTTCGDGAPGPGGGATGRIALAATTDGDPAVAGFQFDVAGVDGVRVASRYVPGGAGAGPGALPADAFFTLAPGEYRATATPMRAPEVPAAHCNPASATATVRGGATTELVLVARCRSTARGGLDVAGRIDHEPEITGVRYDPSKYLAPCQRLAITVTARDPDGDPLVHRFSLVEPPPPAPAGVTFESAGERATFSAAAAGSFAIEAQVCDPAGCLSLRLPVHVVRTGGDGCAAACDDGNPCTADRRDAGGACVHAPVADGTLCAGGHLRVKLLGFNDFHGQLEEGRRVANRPVGGAAVLASYLKAASAGMEAQTIIVHAGDHVGASPPASALLQDEPAIAFLDLLANDACGFTTRMAPGCNVVGTLGNHEFDEGKGELLRLLTGGNHPKGPYLDDPYRGARFPYVSANVVDAATGQPVLPPYVIKRIHGVPVAFIGAVLEETPSIVTASGVAGLRFLDEAEAINRHVPELEAMGVRAMVVTIHQGGSQASYTGPTRTGAGAAAVNGPAILDIVRRLDDQIDVVVSGHSHSFTNALLENARGKPILVTQAFSAGTAFADIDLRIDPATGEVTGKTAQIVTTFADVAPGLARDPAVEPLVMASMMRVGPLVNRVLGTAVAALAQTQNAAGESALGNLIADAQRAAMGTDLAFMNPGGIRAGLDAGPITWGELFTIQPFGNSLVRMTLTGAQVYQVLEEQWAGQAFARMMQISGFEYTWDPARPVGSRVVEVRRGGAPIDRAARFTVTCNNFMAGGGDNFTTFTAGADQTGGPIDLDALVEWVESHTPIAPRIEGRIRTAP